MDEVLAAQLLCFAFLIFLAIKENKRSSKLEDLAKKYDLSYSSPPAPSFTVSSSDRSNVIKGNIKGKNILIYDFNGVPPFKDAFSVGESMSVTKRFTIVCIDGVEKRIGGFLGFAPVKKIDSILSDLMKINI